MSFHVYIARAGFKETPIGPDEWFASASDCAELRVEKHLNRHGTMFCTVTLKDRRNAGLHLTPHGLIDAQEPSKELILTMFRLAAMLGAGVYGENLDRYASPDHWETHTAADRRTRADRREKRKMARRWRACCYALILIAGAMIGWAAG
ncbi:hypothetical protein F2P45_30520 [Massilia sp. CCM 8733]|uniref:Uncharacterized protein n=1 Tax=Massilia mucilaginosa TaxID=2609282 RepID=A0ABX0P4F4_9BURK|nr:hypothetical protein [Massilia mucilaginosa]NHZ93312.1 hypothetical protein [Massilia mucilaginosa]